MTAKTRFGLAGYGVRRAGSFAGKTPGATSTTIVLTATEAPDIASITVTFRPLWLAATKQDETWTPAVIQSETWTRE